MRCIWTLFFFYSWAGHYDSASAVAVQGSRDDDLLFPWTTEGNLRRVADEEEQEGSSAPRQTSPGLRSSQVALAQGLKPRLPARSIALLATSSSESSALTSADHVAHRHRHRERRPTERRLAAKVQGERRDASRSSREQELLGDMGRLEKQLEAAKGGSAELKKKLSDQAVELHSLHDEREAVLSDELHAKAVVAAAAHHWRLSQFADILAFGVLAAVVAWALLRSSNGPEAKAKKFATERVDGEAAQATAHLSGEGCGPEPKMATNAIEENATESSCMVGQEENNAQADLALDTQARSLHTSPCVETPESRREQQAAEIGFAHERHRTTSRDDDSKTPTASSHHAEEIPAHDIHGNKALGGIISFEGHTPQEETGMTPRTPRCEVFSFEDEPDTDVEEEDAAEEDAGVIPSLVDADVVEDAAAVDSLNMTDEDKWWSGL